MKQKPRRDRYGRFAPKRRNVKLKPYVAPNRTATGRFVSKRTIERHPIIGKPVRWHVKQSGAPIAIRPYGYYMVIRALVPGGWETNSTPVFITEAPSESFHQIIWRTAVRENLFSTTESSLIADLRDEALGLIKAKLSVARADQREIIILSSELRVVTEPYVSFQVDVWPGITPPKWLRNVK